MIGQTDRVQTWDLLGVKTSATTDTFRPDVSDLGAFFSFLSFASRFLISSRRWSMTFPCFLKYLLIAELLPRFLNFGAKGVAPSASCASFSAFFTLLERESTDNIAFGFSVMSSEGIYGMIENSTTFAHS